MSNLYKQRYVVSGQSAVRVINSNSRIEARMLEIQEMMKQFPDAQGDGDGFVQGLQAVVAEPVISPEELLENAQKEADDIIAAAEAKSREIIADAGLKAQGIKEQAHTEGYADGLREGNESAERTLAQVRRQMEEEHEQLKEDYRKKIDELEPYLVDIVADVFEKVFHVQFDDKKEILVYLIQKVILNAEGTKEFQVRMSLKDYQFAEEHKHEITEQVGDSVQVDIMADASLTEGQCMIETDSGVFDCGVDVQLEHLIKSLRSLSL